MPEISDIVWGLWFTVVVGIIIAVAVITITQLRRKVYIYFRVINGETSAPISHLKVYGIPPRFRRKKLIGSTDEKGEFKLCTLALNYPVIQVEGKNIPTTAIPTQLISKPKSFPLSPLECRLMYGFLQFPT